VQHRHHHADGDDRQRGAADVDGHVDAERLVASAAAWLAAVGRVLPGGLRGPVREGVGEAGHRGRCCRLRIERHARDACTNHSDAPRQRFCSLPIRERARQEVLSGIETAFAGPVRRERTR
jgi:hypothetical protein